MPDRFALTVRTCKTRKTLVMKSVTFQPNLLIYATSSKDSLRSVLSVLKCTFVIFKHVKLPLCRDAREVLHFSVAWRPCGRPPSPRSVPGLQELMNVRKDINWTSLITDEG